MLRKHPRGLIPGASVAGPTAAYWLCRQGFAVTVVERMPLARVRSTGHAVDLFGPAMDVAEWPGVLPTVIAETGDERRTTRSGRMLVRADADGGEAALVSSGLSALLIHRARPDTDHEGFAPLRRATRTTSRKVWTCQRHLDLASQPRWQMAQTSEPRTPSPRAAEGYGGGSHGTRSPPSSGWPT